MDPLRKIICYGLVSVLFWATKVSFWLLWHTDVSKYAGAVIGLSIGNWLQCRLNSVYTFRARTA